MKRSYVRADGVTLHPGEWLDIGTGIGRFSGIWQNPVVGMMATLDLYRSRALPHERDTFWLAMPQNEAALDGAKIVAGALKSTGSEPNPKAIARMHRPGWSRGRITIVSREGDRNEVVTGWLCGPFGLYEYTTASALGKLRVTAMTHLRSGRRFATFESFDLAAEMVEIADHVAPWGDLPSVDDLGTRPWKEHVNRTFRSWVAAGVGQALGVDVDGTDRKFLVRLRTNRRVNLQ